MVPLMNSRTQRGRVSIVLHLPDSWQSVDTGWALANRKPGLQENVTLEPRVKCCPMTVPFTGAMGIPQETTVKERTQNGLTKPQ